MKHLEKFRARLVNGDDDDLVVRHRPNDLEDVFGIFRAEARGRLVEKINVRRTDHVEADIESFAFTTAQHFPDRGPHDGIAPLAQTELDQLSFQAARPVAS